MSLLRGKETRETYFVLFFEGTRVIIFVGSCRGKFKIHVRVMNDRWSTGDASKILSW